jgi:hypothetical protein
VLRVLLPPAPLASLETDLRLPEHQDALGELDFNRAEVVQNGRPVLRQRQSQHWANG